MNWRAGRAVDRATQRYLLAKTVAAFPGSLKEKQRFVEKAITARLLPPVPVPARETIRTLQTRWEAGDQTVAAYRDRRRTGRPREVLPTAIEQQIRQAIEGGWEVNPHKLTRLLKELAEKHGWDAPTYRQVHRRFAQAGRLVRSSTRHGSRAGEIDGLPHARVVTRVPHDTWALDELKFPVYVRLFDPRLERWVSGLLDVVLIVDVCSTAVVGWHMADPSGRVDENGAVMRTGFDTDDVLGALLSAAIPELAHDSTRPFAGHLAKRIRWDNASAHKTLRESLQRAEIDVDIRAIRKRRAASNGAAERRVGIMKNCGVEQILGHVDDYLPTDRITSDADADLALERTKAAGYTNERLSRLTPIHPEDLHSVEELRGIFDGMVRRYNFEFENRMFRLTPWGKYETARDRRRPRNGKDLVVVMKPQTTKVGEKGIEHSRNGKTERYFPILEGSLLLLDQVVTYHPDPLSRGIFVQWNPDLVFLAPQVDYSEQEARMIGRNATAITRALSDHAQEIRMAHMAKAIGKNAVQRAMDEYARRVDALQAGESEEGAVTPSLPAPDPALESESDSESSPTVLPFDPWAATDPAAFIRPVTDPIEDEE